MIDWNGINNEKASINIVGYEFPEEEDGHDANWLLVSVSMENETGAWEETIPCLLSWELEWMIRWLENVIDGNAEDIELSFLEPEMSIVYIAEAQGLHRFSVLWRKYIDEGWDARVVNVALSEKQICASVDYLKERMEEYPPRGETGRKGKELPGPRIFDDDEEDL